MLGLQKFMMLALVAGMVAACAPTTTIDQEWMSPAARTQPPLQKVVTIFITPDTTMRHAGEDHLAADLAKRGVQATPGYMIFGDRPTQLSNLDTMKAQLRQMGYDGVVTMRIVDREQNIESVPSTFDYYWGYWGPSYYGAYWPGYVYTETVYRLESAAYSLRNDRLVWSALTKTVDPSSAHQLVDQTSEIVAGQLVRRGLSG